MAIDARQIERVRDRIAQYKSDESRCVMEKYIDAEDLELADKVLAAYAATLPREVEVERWLVLLSNGKTLGVYGCQNDAATQAALHPASQIVRLTGTALLPTAEGLADMSNTPKGEREEALEIAQRVVDTWGEGNPPIVILARAYLSTKESAD